MVELENNNIITCSDEIYKKCRFMLTGGNNKVSISENVNINLLNVKIEGNNNTVIIEKGVIVKDQLYINITDSFINIKIDENTTFENNYITAADDYNYVNIGKDCMFAMGGGIVASDFHSIIDLQTGKRINNSSGVSLGAHVWVGMNSIILKNCSIGDNSVIGSCSLVVKNIPNNVIAAGNPAKVIKEGITWKRERFSEKIICSNEDFASYMSTSIKNDISFNIESMTDKRITGWAFIKGLDSYNTEFYIERELQDGEKEQYKAKSFARGDVADYFKDNKYLFSGFECNMEFCNKKIKSIKLILKNLDNIGYDELINN